MDTGQPGVPARPRRTCVGCRARVAKTDLLRLVVVDGSVTPDTAGRAPGRGAHLHPDSACLDLALRRRAFPRAFRLTGPLDPAPVRRFLEAGDTRSANEQRVRQAAVEEAGREAP